MKEKRAAVESLTPEQLCGQVLCLNIDEKDDPAEVEKKIRRIQPGSIYVYGMSAEQIKMYTDMVNRYAVYPVIVAADVESGPGDVLKGEELLPHPMAWGACDDEGILEAAGRATGRICRKNGIHWTFSPVVDINLNFNNPLVNIRCPSDSAKQVAKMASAYARGLMHCGMMVTGAKHFPGDGVDDRNQHFCTTVNSLTKEEWENTFGYVYRRMIEEGTASIMVAHIALPCYDSYCDELGYMPAVLSHALMSDLLKKKFGFQGCIVSDAMSMIGSASRVPIKDLAVSFLKAGGDMVLFPEKTDYDRILSAVQSGELSLERMRDAVCRIVRMKEKARLFEEKSAVLADLSEPQEDIAAISDLIGEKSVKIVRNFTNVLPFRPKPHAKFLLIDLLKLAQGAENPLSVVASELQKRGYVTQELVNPSHYAVQEAMQSADHVLINCKISSKDYNGGSIRMGWDCIMAFWRAYVLEHPSMAFISFGDPYKLYELPFLKTYVNAFSYSPSSQRAAVKLILGEIFPSAKNPVSLQGFFEREV